MDVNSILARSQQSVVQFAAMFPLKPEMSRRERDALKNFLTEADPELFQLIEEPAKQPVGPTPLFVATRQYSVGSLIAKAPSLVFAPESVTITQVVRIGAVKTGGDGTLQNSILNKKMREFFVKMQEVVKGLKYTRVGKIFEFNFGPFNPDEKKGLLNGLLSRPDDIIGMQAQITRLVKATEDMNVTTMVNFMQADGGQPFLMQAKIDMNNRNHKNNLEARNIDQVFSDADTIIQDHLEWMFGATP